MLSAFLGLALLSLQDPPQPSTATVLQGNAVSVRIELSSEKKTAPRVKALEKEIPCYRTPSARWKKNRRNQAWQCWIGVPSDAREGLHEIRLIGSEGAGTAGWLEVVADTFSVEPLRLSKDAKKLLNQDTPEQSKTIRAGLGRETDLGPWKKPFLLPVSGKNESPYGERRTVDGAMRPGYHRGADIGAPRGTPIRSAQDGIVVISRNFPEEGNMVAVDHGQGVVTAYLHASKLRAAEGQKVKRGDILAEVGSTGISTSDHLHFGVYLHDVPVNPLRWLAQFEPD